MILRRRHRRRQPAEAELFEAGQETLLLLAAKYPEHEFGGGSAATPRHHRQDEAREKRVIEIGDAAPSLPLGLLRVDLCCGHFLSRPRPLLATNLRRYPAHFTGNSWPKL